MRTRHLVASLSLALGPVAGALTAIGSVDGTVRLLRADGATVAVLPRQRGRIRSLDFLPDGSRLSVGVFSGLVTEWIVEPKELRQRLVEVLPR